MSGVGVDVGGTFTDFAWWSGSELSVGKTSSTPDQSVGVIQGTADLLDGERVPVLVHGTTVATNALLERAGVVTALVTDPGFEDLLEIGRQHRPSLYDPFADPAVPVVPRGLRFGWRESDAPAIRDALGAAQAEAVAVCLLGSYADGEAESRIAALLGDEFVVSESHRVVSEFREFERASTTSVNAYLQPRVAEYLDRLEEGVVPTHSDRVLVMRSSGGTVPPADASRLASSILLSGPAGGVVASAALGHALGADRIVTFDMGGTSTDVARIEGSRPEIAYERTIDGLVVRMPSVAVHTVGAGGGSVGWRDPGGALRVGPRSAGAHPGPACYSRGGVEPAVTDANVALGRIGEELAGGLRIDAGSATEALARLGAEIGLDALDTARGMVEVVEATMGRAIRAVSVEQGADPREAILVAFGGAGGLHAGALARALEMRGVLVPPYAGVFSALGLLLAPPRHDGAKSVLLRSEEGLDTALNAVADEVATGLRSTTGSEVESLETLVDVRYVGQSHETPVAYAAGEGWERLAERFHVAHRERNGFARPEDPIEAVTVRAAAVGAPVLRWDQLPEHRPHGDARRRQRWVDAGDGPVEAQVVWRPGLRPGEGVAGPAVIEDPDSTTWVAPGERATIHPSGSIEVEW